MAQRIRAIETRYAGHRFRSRLEARWAVFFDALGIDWEYEADGFETPAGRYLPDFRIELHFPFSTWTWFEVKPPGAADDPRHQAFVDGGNFLTIARGIPRSYADQYGPRHFLITHDPRNSPFSRPGNVQRVGFWYSPSTKRTTTFTASTEPNRWIDAAYAAARSARFEHGETGR